jgi:5-methylcytosine-specific restriction endonuclease McrA
MRNKELHKACKKRYAVKVKLRRIEWFKENGPCCKCGSWENLELDHKIPVKRGDKWDNKQIWFWSLQRRLKELSLCQILCRPCHRKKTSSDFRTYRHGRNEYERQGCRCRICKDAMAKHKREQRARIKVRKLALSKAGSHVTSEPIQ